MYTMHHPGVEPGSRAWKAHILTVGLMVHVIIGSVPAINTSSLCVIFIFSRTTGDPGRAENKLSVRPAKLYAAVGTFSDWVVDCV